MARFDLMNSVDQAFDGDEDDDQQTKLLILLGKKQDEKQFNVLVYRMRARAWLWTLVELQAAAPRCCNLTSARSTKWRLVFKII